MKFGDWWLTRSWPTRYRMVKACGVGLGHLWHIAEDHGQAGPKLALKIERFTAGAVNRHDLRPDIYPMSGCDCESCTRHRSDDHLENDDAA